MHENSGGDLSVKYNELMYGIDIHKSESPTPTLIKEKGRFVLKTDDGTKILINDTFV